MGSVTTELALDCRAILGESPVCVASGEVFFVDINGKTIHAYSSRNGSHSTCATAGKMVGCIVPKSTGGLMAALEEEIVAIECQDHRKSNAGAAISLGQIQSSVPATAMEAHNGHPFRFNDGKCDPSGRFWVGDMNINWRNPEAPKGALYVLEKGAALKERLANVSLSNGLAWSSAGDRMFFIDSATRRVDCFDYLSSTGDITNRRPVLHVLETDGIPDGMAIDATDKLWVVLGEGGTVRQYDPETGKELIRVDLPVRRPTSCAFGGADLTDLYVTTRLEYGDQPSDHAGGLFKCHVPGIKGASFADAYLG